MRFLSSMMVAACLVLPVTQAAADVATLTVTGSATVETVPDLATVSLGVTTIGATAGEAMTANSAAMQAVIDRIKGAGIEAKDIQTSNLSLNPNWVTNEAGTASEIKGYTASNMVTVRVRVLDKTAAVLDAAVTDGANTLNGLSFGLADSTAAEDEARTKAVADAMRRAKVLAEAAGLALGPVMSVTEGGFAAPLPGPMYRMAEAAMPPVENGVVGVSASVTMVFKIGE